MDAALYEWTLEHPAGFDNSRLDGLPVGFAEVPPYDLWFRDCLLPCKPAVLPPGLTSAWPARSRWLRSDGRPDLSALAHEFGDALVPVANCDRRQYDANPKQNMTLCDYIAYWNEHVALDYRSPQGCLYLKDWHLCRAFPKADIYSTPIHFSSDWLNEFADSKQTDDYRFVYMGPKGSWTPFHADVFRSHSWSANMCGRKRWLFYSPGQEDLLRDPFGNLPYDVMNDPLPDAAPAPLEVIQEAGEVIFVPSGWYHQVLNLEDTISINHNWVNGCNLYQTWAFLQAELCSVQREIEDCRTMQGWEQQCQLIMKSCTGMDYQDFYLFLQTIAENRIELLKQLPGTSLDEMTRNQDDRHGMPTMLGPWHAIFDLHKLLPVFCSVAADPHINQLVNDSLLERPSHLTTAAETVMAEAKWNLS
uniref:2-oxoglutarate and iron-dependent oxygenase JMJD4-like isoform X1 n=1 Tax=Myxine glutinosa TaxID=7769 RepID=UPI00358F641A